MMKRLLILTGLFLSVVALAACGGGTSGVVISANTAPVASAGGDQGRTVGLLVNLNGSGSTDADNDTLTYSWSLTAKPTGSTAVLSDPAAVKPSFVADIVGVYVVQLIVNDGTVDSAADTATITATIPGLPDTGQMAPYSTTTTFGEDADYEINSPSYTANGDGTVTDNVTGLMWQQVEDNFTHNWYAASGTYEATANPNSINVCGSLTLGGYSDWRLPTKKELVYIVDYSTSLPAINSIFTSAITQDLPYYWSITPFAGSTGLAWSVDFDHGGFSYDGKGGALYVRCVR